MSSSDQRAESPFVLVLLSLAVVVVGGALWLAITVYYPSLADRANFGNLFGGINTLFAGLGFAAVAYTLVLQQRALRLQRSQLEEQGAQLAEQERRSQRQAFETMLVQLLGFHHTIAADIEFKYGQQHVKGRHAIRVLADEAAGHITNKSRQADAPKSSIGVAQEGYESFHDRHRGILDHYFRNLYHIVKMIDNSGQPDARRYTSLVRAQLSPPELLLLFYNGLSIHGAKFKPLIEKYGLLEQLPTQQLAIPGHKALYDGKAYG